MGKAEISGEYQAYVEALGADALMTEAQYADFVEAQAEASCNPYNDDYVSFLENRGWEDTLREEQANFGAY